MYMSLIDGAGADIEGLICAAHWQPLVPMGDAHPAGVAEVTDAMPQGGLCFALSHSAAQGTGVLACHQLDIAQGHAVLRLDEVCFPVDAVAHRHVHTGPGIRYLVRGALQIQADTHTADMAPGQSWFEAANSPVRAVALQTRGVTSFVRCMAVPLADHGRSTFTLMDPADGNLPRLQVTHRHIDHVFQVDAG